MTVSISQAAVHADSYLAFTALIILGTGVFVNPKKNSVHWWLYWVIAPLASAGLIAAAIRSILGGLGLGALLFLFLALCHLRYHDDDWP